MLNFYPKKVFEYFEKISSIPHGSYNTGKIAGYLENFAKERNLKYIKDDSDNLIIFKDGSSGKENLPPVILQGHTDMVCASDGEFDFINQSISIDTDGEYVFANGTTLGGDNGIAVAMMLAILDDNTMDLPPLECVFTSDEEVGMLGAVALDMSALKGKRMINVDSEIEGVFTIGCAGGVSCNADYSAQTHVAPLVSYRVEVSDFHGGHSGIEIDGGYANAIKVLTKFLIKASDICTLELVNISGGAADNAIPKNASCDFAVQEDISLDVLSDIASRLTEEIKVSYNEAALSIKVSTVDINERACIGADDTAKIISLLDSLPNGVIAYDEEVENAVKTSCNIGVALCDNNIITLRMSVRSSVNGEKEQLCKKIETICSSHGATCVFSGEYPAWEPRKNSQLCTKATEIYENMYGKAPVVEVIHAGLECSVFADRISDFDCISIGPNLIDIHTPCEKMDIKSVGRVYNYVCELLKNL